MTPRPTALVTGGAKRIGAEICRTLHSEGYNLVVHYNHSVAEAQQLINELNGQRPDSAVAVNATLSSKSAAEALATHALSLFGHCNLLVNNASSFYATPITEISETQWDDLFASNAKAPLFLSQALYASLKENQGSIVNISDIHTLKPLPNHTVYCMAKAANNMLTRSLAVEMAPDVRVNGIAPGAMLWPETQISQQERQSIEQRIPLQHLGGSNPIAKAVVFLANSQNYITGQILPVDGGKSLT